MIFSGEVEHHSALSWFVRIKYGMVRIVPCSTGRAVVNLLFRQLAGVPIIDVCIDHVLVDYCQAFVLGEFPLEVEESSLGCEEVVRKIWIIRLPQQAGFVPYTVVFSCSFQDTPRSLFFFADRFGNVRFGAKGIKVDKLFE